MYSSQHWAKCQNCIEYKASKKCENHSHECNTLQRIKCPNKGPNKALNKAPNKANYCAVLDDLAAVLFFRYFVWNLGGS